jgi:acylphosphatase
MTIARRFLVDGRVQGVGFRYFAREAATREGVNGWVRNLGDGRVEIFAEGDDAAIERLERRIRTGPPGAFVSRVDVSEEPPERRRSGFEIRPSTRT